MVEVTDATLAGAAVMREQPRRSPHQTAHAINPEGARISRAWDVVHAGEVGDATKQSLLYLCRYWVARLCRSPNHACLATQYVQGAENRNDSLDANRGTGGPK